MKIIQGLKDYYRVWNKCTAFCALIFTGNHQATSSHLYTFLPHRDIRFLYHMFVDVLSTSSTNAICRIRLFILQQPKPLLLLHANHMCVTGLIPEAKAAWSAWFSISTNNTPPFLMVNCQRHPARFCHCHVIHYFLCLH